jgi:hypothetical protein
VSNAYSRPDQLNPRLRERILRTADELGYCGPDPAARTLRSGHAGVVGVLLAERLSYAFTDPGAVRFLEGVAQVGEREGTGLLLLPPSGPGGAGPPAGTVRGAVVDGFLVYSMSSDASGVQAVVAAGRPPWWWTSPGCPGPPLSNRRRITDHDAAIRRHHRLPVDQARRDLGPARRAGAPGADRRARAAPAGAPGWPGTLRTTPTRRHRPAAAA